MTIQRGAAYAAMMSAIRDACGAHGLDDDISEVLTEAMLDVFDGSSRAAARLADSSAEAPQLPSNGSNP